MDDTYNPGSPFTCLVYVRDGVSDLQDIKLLKTQKDTLRVYIKNFRRLKFYHRKRRLFHM